MDPRELTEAERRVMRYGITPGCPYCAKALDSLRAKGLMPGEHLVPYSREAHEQIHRA